MPVGVARPLPLRRPAGSDLATALGLREPTGIFAAVRTVPVGLAGASALCALSGPVLIARGVVMRTVTIGRREATLLHGPGDILAPVDAEPSPFRARSRALAEASVAVLSQDVMRQAAKVPEVAARIAAGVHAQADELSVQALLTQLPSVTARLEVLLPRLAERHGTVCADGVLLPAFLSHTVLAALVGVRRPSFTTALGELTRATTLLRLDDGRWMVGAELAGLAA